MGAGDGGLYKCSYLGKYLLHKFKLQLTTSFL
jgi:hypothetical protein